MGVENAQKVLTVDYVQTLLLQEVDYGKDVESSESALAVKDKKKPNKKFKCFECGGPHFAKYCKKKKQSSETSERALFSAFLAENTSTDWFIDSGASAHMTKIKKNFFNEREPEKKDVLVANNHKISVLSVGDIKQQVFANGDKKLVEIKDVQYVPDICVNLLSVSQMVKKGNTIVFNKDGCKIYSSDKEIIATGSLINNKFKLDVCENGSEIACAVNNDFELWHRRLGHIGISNMSFLNKIEGLNLKTKDTINCIACLEGKQSRLPFNEKGHRSSKLLELIHSDVCGPMSVKSIGGSRYFVSFIDDCSRKVFVYMINKKSDVYDCFVKFKILVENQLERKIKIFRSDNGLEF